MPVTWPWSRKTPALTQADLDRALEQQAEAYERRTALVAQETAETVHRALNNGSANYLPQFPQLASTAQRPVFAFNWPYNYVVPQAPYQRPESTVTVLTLRHVADSYDILRSCILHLKREVFATELRFVAKDPKQSEALAAKIKEAEAFFGLNGGLGGVNVTREEYEGRILEDLLVIGVGTAFYQFNRAQDRSLLETLAIDAATIRPRVDAYGWPGPDDIWYEQWIQGIPVSLKGFKREELWFRGLPNLQRSWTPYPASAVEFLISVVDTALRSDQWNKGWLTDGSTVDERYAMPQEWTPDQVMQWQQHWDLLLSGNNNERHKAKFLPNGTAQVGSNSRKDHDFAEFERWLMKRVCSVMGVQPASIGYSDGQYKVTQDESMTATSEFGVHQLLAYRKLHYDDVLEKLGYAELEAQNVTEAEEDQGAVVDRHVKAVAGGLLTPNEARQDQGLDAVEGGDTLFIPTTLQPLDLAINPPEPVAPGGDSSASGQDHPDDGFPRVDRTFSSQFDESQHPRQSGGRFGDKGKSKPSGAAGGSGGPSGSAGSGEGGATGLTRPGFRLATSAERKALKIPPAWDDVQVAEDPNARLQAVGRDSKGRQQSRYSAAHTEAALQAKFTRLRALHETLPGIMGNVDRELTSNGKNAEEAAVIKLIALTGMRVGGEDDTGAEVQAYGATTLKPEHVKIEEGTATLEFTGKKGVANTYVVSDPEVVQDLKTRIEGGSETLFQTNDDKVRKALAQFTPGEQKFKTHDLRGWKATDTARQLIGALPSPTNPLEFWENWDVVADRASKQINDSVAVAMTTYVDPLLFDNWRTKAGVPDGATRPKGGTRKTGGPGASGAN